MTATVARNGNAVELRYSYYDASAGETVQVEKTFISRGAYAYQVFDSGRTEQVCEGLLPTGPTLKLSGSLEETVRNAFAATRA